MSMATIQLIGRVVNDPEFRQSNNQTEFVTFRLAVDQQHGDDAKAAFYNCTGNQLIANRIRKAKVAKGRLIHVSGAFTARDYTTKNNEPRVSLDVSLYDWDYVGSKPKDKDEQSEQGTPSDASAGSVHEESQINDDDDLPL